MLPSSRREMALIGPIVRNDLFFFVTILALVALMILFDQRRRLDGGGPAGSGSATPPATAMQSRALQRKAQWSARKERLWSTAVYTCSFIFIMLVTAQFIYAKSTTSLSPAHFLTFANGQLSIPASEASDGELHRYEVTVAGKEVRFLLFKKPDGKDRDGARRLPDLRSRGLLQKRESDHLQKLLGAGQSAIGGAGWRLQSDSTEIIECRRTDRDYPGRSRRSCRNRREVAVFLRLLYQSFRRQQRRKLLAGVAITVGVAVATAMIAIAVDVGDKINRELRSYGANIVVYPEDAGA